MSKILPDCNVVCIGCVVVLYFVFGVFLTYNVDFTCVGRNTKSYCLAPWGGGGMDINLPSASTRQGDLGKTMGLQKNHPKIQVLGLLDELNVVIGLFVASNSDFGEELSAVQCDLASVCSAVLFGLDSLEKNSLERCRALKYVSASKYKGKLSHLLNELGYFYAVIQADLDPFTQRYFERLLSFSPAGATSYSKRECSVDALCLLGENLRRYFPDEMMPVVWLLEKIRTGQHICERDLAWFEQKYCAMAAGVEDYNKFVPSGHGVVSVECDYMRVKVREFERKNAHGDLVVQDFYNRPPYSGLLGQRQDLRPKWAFINRLSDYMFYMVLKARMNSYVFECQQSA